MSTKIVGSNFPDSAAAQLAPSKAGYGENGFSGASSDLPNENTTSRLGADMRSKDPGLAAVIAGGAKSGVGNVQTRNVGPDSLPITRGHKDPNAGRTPKIPDDISKNDAPVSPQPKYTTSK